MKKVLSIITVLFIAASVFANGVCFNSPGTRAISMGGAYISHVNDYSAPYWNPAGLQNTEGFQASFFITDLIPLATYKRDSLNIDAEAKTLHNIAPNASFLWTCILHDKLRMGLSFIVPAGLGVEWEGDDLLALSGPDSLTTPVGNVPNPYYGAYKWKSSIVVWNLSLSASYKLGDKLNVGGAFHLVNGSMTMKKGIDAVNLLTGQAGQDNWVDNQYSEESSGWGYGFGLGLQYMLNEKISLGASMRTKMTVDFEGDAENTAFESYAPYGIPSKVDFSREITWPLWIGGGISFKPTDRLLLAAEAQWSGWAETQKELVADYENAAWDTLVEDPGKNIIELDWKDAVQIRFGAEYMLNENLAIRGGFYIDPAPGPDETQTILIPNTDFNVITFGAGYKLDKLSFDVAFEYLIGTERDVPFDPDPLAPSMEGKHGLNIVVPSFAVTYKF